MDNQHKHIKGVSGIYSISGAGRAYVGSAVCLHSRWKAHRIALRRGTHRNQHLQRAWLKHGEGSFAFAVLEVVADKAILIAREQAWINATPNRYNISPTAGSHLGAKRNPETIARMSAAQKGRRPSQATLDAARAYQTGRVQSEETKRKRSLSMRGVRRGPMSQEARTRMSIAQTGLRRTFTQEHRQRLSVAAAAREAKKKELKHG